MKALRSLFIGAASVLLATTTAIAAPVAHIVCTPSTSTSPTGSQPINSNDITANLSYFDIGITPSLNIGSSSSGAGAGKVTFQTAEFHISLSKFAEFIGASFDKCNVFTTLADGNKVDYALSLVAIQSIAAVAQSPHNPTDTPAAYTDLVLEFGGILVKTTSGSDDGGTSGTGSTPRN
jgi:hypothetical protein